LGGRGCSGIFSRKRSGCQNRKSSQQHGALKNSSCVPALAQIHTPHSIIRFPGGGRGERTARGRIPLGGQAVPFVSFQDSARLEFSKT
jgi:hypothetical protein